MTIQKSINLAITGFIAILAATILVTTLNVSAQEGETQEATPVTTQAEESTETPEQASTTNNYDYVAQPKDSYSLMARKAVQTHGINNSVNLSGAQIIFVETNLTKAAGSPVLNLGQTVSIDGNLVAEWVGKAQSLTEEQQALWQPYANNANFNTDAIGQPAN